MRRCKTLTGKQIPQEYTQVERAGALLGYSQDYLGQQPLRDGAVPSYTAKWKEVNLLSSP